MHATVTRDVARTLDDAALHIDHHGWCRDSLYEHNPDWLQLPRACALGAIHLVTHGIPISPDDSLGVDRAAAAHCRAAVAYLADYLNTHGDWPFDTPSRVIVTEWNDHRVHTATEAVATLHAAAAHYRHTAATRTTGAMS